MAQGQARDLPITIAETPAETTAKAEQRKNAPQKPRQTNSLGLTVSDLTAEQMKTLKLKNGVQIDGVDGPAARAGLQRVTSCCASATPTSRTRSSSPT